MNTETETSTIQGEPASVTRPTQLLPLVRHLSYRLTPLLLNTSLTPNQVTVIAMCLGLFCAICFAIGDHLFQITGALLLVASYTFDNCDGEIARLKNLSSELGAKLDDISDWIVDSSFFISLGYGTTQTTEQSIWFYLGCFAAAGAVIDYIVDCNYFAKKKQQANSKSRAELAITDKKPISHLDWAIYILHKLSRADFCIIVLILSLLNIVWILLPFAAIGAQIYWITDLFERSRGYHT